MYVTKDLHDIFYGISSPCSVFTAESSIEIHIEISMYFSAKTAKIKKVVGNLIHLLEKEAKTTSKNGLFLYYI